MKLKVNRLRKNTKLLPSIIPQVQITLTNIAVTILLTFPMTTGTYAQDGFPFITHFDYSTKVAGGCQHFTQDRQGLVYVSNRNGLFSFDGNSWAHLATVKALLVLGIWGYIKHREQKLILENQELE